MGACSFFTVEKGWTPKEAFKNAKRDAEIMHGCGGYTGTIAEKTSFKFIDLPKNVDPEEYANENIENFGKWDSAGCVLLEKGRKRKKVKTCDSEVKRKSGRKKWKTRYEILDGRKVLDWKKTKSKAIKRAKELAIKNQKEYRIEINKVLTSHDNLEAVIKPKKLKTNEKAKPNKYLFFGIASM